MKQTKTMLTNCAMALAAGIFLSGENMAQQTNYRLTPEQQKNIQMFIYSTDDYKIAYRDYRKTGDMTPLQIKQEIVENIDPILISKYLIFSKDWLPIIGNNKETQVTRQQFKKWTNTLDKVYECYEEFMGKRPFHRDTIFVGTSKSGLANSGMNDLYVNLSRKDWNVRIKEIRQGNPTYTMLHEMGHIFSSTYAQYVPRESAWMGEVETAAELLISYALEKGHFTMNRGGEIEITGSKYRHNKIEDVIQKGKRGEKIDDFGYHKDTAYDLYMFGLVELVGWETMKKAVQSYNPNNKTYISTKEYDPGNNKQGYSDVKSLNNSRAHEFFDRVSYFHDQARELGKTDKRVLNTIPSWGKELTGAQVLRKMPDNGKFLDEYFTVKTFQKAKDKDEVKMASARKNKSGIFVLRSNETVPTVKDSAPPKRTQTNDIFKPEKTPLWRNRPAEDSR